MSSYSSSSPLLAPVEALNTRLGSTYLPSLPLPLAFVIHAARVSLAYRGLRSVFKVKAEVKEGSVAKRQEDKEGWLYDLGGFLVMAWGGSFLTAYLSNSTPLQLVSPLPLLTYSLVHIYLGVLFTVLPPISPIWLDTLVPILDGATRSNAIIGGINLARNHPSNPLLRDSLVFQLLMGTIGACGGGQLAATLGVFHRQKEGWTLTTPPFLKARSVMEGIDVIAALAGSVAYSLTTNSHPDWVTILNHKYNPFVSTGNPFKGYALTQAQAQALTTLVVAAFFAYRAVALHWITKSPKSEGKRLQVEAKKQQGKVGNGDGASPAKSGRKSGGGGAGKKA